MWFRKNGSGAQGSNFVEPEWATGVWATVWAGDVGEAKKMFGTHFDPAEPLGLADFIPSQI